MKPLHPASHSVMGDPRLKLLIERDEADIRDADERFMSALHDESCKFCNGGPNPPFSMAFQPIVNVNERTIMAYEGLARGPNGEPSATVLEGKLHVERYSIDQRCREKAIAVSTGLGILETTADLCVNFYPNAVYEPKQCLRRTFNAAGTVNFPLSRIIFEIAELEEVQSHQHLKAIMTEYRKHGLRTAIDDFGKGHSGLSLLSVFQPDMIKIDGQLIRGIDTCAASRATVRSIVQACREREILVIAEGVERGEDMTTLCDLGIELMQGNWFAPPAFEALPPWPVTG